MQYDFSPKIWNDIKEVAGGGEPIRKPVTTD